MSQRAQLAHEQGLFVETARVKSGNECFSKSLSTRMNSRVPSPARSSSRRRRKMAKQSGKSQFSRGRAWFNAPGLRSNSARYAAARTKRPPGLTAVSALLVADLHMIHVALHNHRVMSVTHRHRVVVAIKSDQRQRIHSGGGFAAGIERGRWKRQKRGLVFLEQYILRALLAPQTPFSVLGTLLQEPAVEFFQIANLRHPHQEVQPGVFDH